MPCTEGPIWSGQPAQVLSDPLFHQSLLLECDKYQHKTVAEAKVDFLKWIYRWPTFGSSFFEVKVGLDPHPAPAAIQAPFS